MRLTLGPASVRRDPVRPGQPALPQFKSKSTLHLPPLRRSAAQPHRTLHSGSAAGWQIGSFQKEQAKVEALLSLLLNGELGILSTPMLRPAMPCARSCWSLLSLRCLVGGHLRIIEHCIAIHNGEAVASRLAARGWRRCCALLYFQHDAARVLPPYLYGEVDRCPEAGIGSEGQ